MKVLTDTSVVISGVLSDHPQHAYAQPWLAQAKAGAFEALVSGHSLAELYSVLTRLPRTPRITPAEALQLIQTNLAPHTVVTLSAKDYVRLIEDLAQVGIAGGAVYDAVIAKAAELVTPPLPGLSRDPHKRRVSHTNVREPTFNNKRVI
jgi:predicted nucleic acid-binding protein